MHRHVDKAPGDHPRAEIVAPVAGPLHQRKFLVEALPVAGHEIAPEVIGPPRQGLADRRQFAGVVVEDLTGGDFERRLTGQAQPVVW